MKIRITNRSIELTELERYRDPAKTIVLSHVSYGPGVAYVVTYGKAPKFFNSLAEALADLSSSLLNEEMSRLIQALN